MGVKDPTETRKGEGIARERQSYGSRRGAGTRGGHPYVSWGKNRTHPKNFISGDFSFLAFEWAPFGSFGLILT